MAARDLRVEGWTHIVLSHRQVIQADGTSVHYGGVEFWLREPKSGRAPVTLPQVLRALKRQAPDAVDTIIEKPRPALSKPGRYARNLKEIAESVDPVVVKWRERHRFRVIPDGGKPSDGSGN